MQYITGTSETPIASALCGQHVYSNNAATGVAFKALEDRLAAESTPSKPYWEIIAPLVISDTGTCFTPDVQGTSSNQPGERYVVTRFMKLRILAIEKQPHPNVTIQIVGCIECSDIDTVTGVFHSQLVK